MRVNKEYLDMCQKSVELQNIWCADIKHDNGKAKSNIHPGDKFSFGRNGDRYGMITSREFDNGDFFYTYTEINNSDSVMDSFFHNEINKRRAQSCFRWIPSIEKLIELNVLFAIKQCRILGNIELDLIGCHILNNYMNSRFKMVWDFEKKVWCNRSEFAKNISEIISEISLRNL